MTTPDGRSETAFLAPLPGRLSGTGLPARINSLLEEAIVSGALVPGQRLRAEVLAEHYGVSPMPVREALRSLEAAGWVKIRPRYGAYVAERSEQELREVFDVRAVLEGHVARRAAELRTDADLRALRQAMTAGEQAAARGDGSLLRSLHAEFHTRLRAATRNAVLQAMSDELDKRARFYFSIVGNSLRLEWVDVHEQLLAAVERQDGDLAERIAREHVEETGQAVERLLT
ncbi:MAG TPA: GntR family transcriptional regulator [Kineosporiaceae bacterium]|nr:GntR family transcriptional regulator [Kineosporiaceae bacterium]